MITIHRACNWRGKTLPREVSDENGNRIPYTCKKVGKEWVAFFNDTEIGRGAFRDMEWKIQTHRKAN